VKVPPASGLVLIVLLWAACFAAQGVYAADAQPDMRVLVDISGSMKKKPIHKTCGSLLLSYC